jgi:hypothetical protein
VTDPARLVANGRSMTALPPSRAPLLFLVGIVLMIVGAAVSSVAVLALVGLAVFAGGGFAAWLRLTAPGRVILALPFVAWVAGFVTLGVGAGPLVIQGLAVVAVALSLFAFVMLIRPMGGIAGMGMRRGAIEGSFVRTLRDDGIAECRVDDAGITIRVASGDPKSYPFEELSPARIEERAAACDLVVDDVYGDPLLRLRAPTPDERAGMQAIADEIARRAPKRRR